MKKLHTYYCVIEVYYSDGFVIANIVQQLQAHKKPEGGIKFMETKDIYIDWYSSKLEAEEAVRNARAECMMSL